MNYTNFYFMALDIETSKEMSYDEKLNKYMPVKTWLSYGVCKLYDIKGITHKTCKFREWDTLKSFFDTLAYKFKKKLICFVHNLAFEFDFIIKNISKPKKFICNSTHSAISATIEEYRLEFRCTYQLSREPLEKIGEMFDLPKLDSGYRTIYPDDEVTTEEWDYCERDCDILVPYILNELKTYKLINRIPLTSTGKVRTEMKELIGSDIPDWDLMPPENCYHALDRAFRGAITTSNPQFTGRLITRPVKSFDEKSKYPGVMLCKEYPYTIEKMEDFKQDTYNEYKFWIGKVRFNYIRSKFEWGHISANTCERVDIFSCDIFNGKILFSGSIDIYITNIDLQLITETYTYRSIEFLEFYPCKKYSRLPNHFIELIKKYAQPKYEIGKLLKEMEKQGLDETSEYKELHRSYMESKAKLNGIYGMMVQKLIQEEFVIDDNFNWHIVRKPYKQIPNKHLYRNFLYGIFITSYSRYDLVMNIVYNCPHTFVYCDTDSIKYIDTGVEFEDVNDEIPDFLSDLPYLKGFNRFEEEPTYSKFLTYGAKKYAFEKNGHFGFTVAGLPKSTSIKNFDEFKLGTVYRNCKLGKRYIYHRKATDIDLITQEVIGVYDIDDNTYGNGGIALFETDYKLDMTKNDLIYLERNKKRWLKDAIQPNM